MTNLNKEQLKNEIYKLKRHFAPSPFTIGSQGKETVSLDAVIDLIDRLEESEITELDALNRLAENVQFSANEIASHLEKLSAHNGQVTYGETKTLSPSEPETVATVIYDYMKAAQRFKEILGMEVEEVEE